MQENVEYRGFEPDARFEKLMASRIDRLNRRCRNFRPEAVFLRTMVEGFRVHKRFRVSIALDVPGTTIIAAAEAESAAAATRQAFDEAERQLVAYKFSLRGEHKWRRAAARSAPHAAV